LCTKVIDVSTSAERQKVTLSGGEVVSARLVVLANGLNVGLRRTLGIERQILSPCHSISLGFDLVPVGRPAFDVPALTYFSERASESIPYITLFPVGKRMRANLFAYREADDPRLRAMRRNPVETLRAALPRLSRITREFAVAGDIKTARPTSMSRRAIARQASSWLATPLQPPALSPAPAPTRCSPTSANSVTSISPPGLPAKA
jgi:2-polyprenyl-6-methoxyphenol hydroxylase-like FAD-dependent oxidoreductase